MHRRGVSEHERVKMGAANRTSPIQDRERERQWVLGQDQVGVKPDMRQTISESFALDGEGYCIKRGGRTWASQDGCHKQGVLLYRPAVHDLRRSAYAVEFFQNSRQYLRG